MEIMEKYQRFCKENPLGFEKEEFDKIERDIKHPRNGVVYDEYVEFMLWSKGLKSRQEYFSEYIEHILPLSHYPNLLEVGAGKNGRLSMLLSRKGYRMTAMDPKLKINEFELNDVKCEREAFLFGKTNVSNFDAVIAQEPCEATEHIIRACVEQKKDFVIGLCGTPHRLISGDVFEDVFEWYDYLEKIDKDHCVLVQPNLIPGYGSFVMIGKWGEL